MSLLPYEAPVSYTDEKGLLYRLTRDSTVLMRVTLLREDSTVPQQV